MPYSYSSPFRFSASHRSHHRLRWVGRLACGLLLSGVIGWAGNGMAQSSAPESPTPEAPATEEMSPESAPTDGLPAPDRAPDDAPAELVTLLSELDAAASRADLEAVMAVYSPAFENTDGMTYEDLRDSLTELWKRFPGLTYETTLNSWQQEEEAIVAETTTTITGTEASDGRPTRFTATITSRQRFQNLQIVEQEILAERTELAVGNNPPTVQVILPEEVTIGQEFEFDAIVLEPLGDQLLLGAALEEEIVPENYFDEVPVDLEALYAGGLFKIGRAPAIPSVRWISGVLVREGGVTTVTQRLRIVRPTP